MCWDRHGGSLPGYDIAMALDDERHLVFECSIFEDLRRTHSQLFGSEVAFDIRRFFAHTDQRAVVMYILGCLSLIGHADG